MRTEDDPSMLKHIRVHALADMLDVPSLKALAVEKFESTLENEWVPTDFAGVVAEVYATSNARDNGIRKALISSARFHLGELVSFDVFKDILFANGEFSVGLLVAIGSASGYNCRWCGGKNGLNCTDCGRAQSLESVY